MFWDSYLEVHTPRGAFRLVLRDPLWASRSPRPRVATREETEHAWFFLRYDLEYANWSELGPVLDLHAELTGERIFLTGHAADDVLMQRVRQELLRGLRMGLLQFEVLDLPQPMKPRELEYIRLPQPDPEPRGPSLREEVFHYFGICLVDELNQPLKGIEVVFSWGSRKESDTTNGSGIAFCDVLENSAAKLDLDDRENLSEALKARWDQARGMPPANWVKQGANTTLVPYRSDQPLASVSVKPEVQHTVSVQPWVRRLRIRGAFSRTNKCFILPTALSIIRQLKSLCAQHPNCGKLIVGHTDVTGEPEVNGPLSLDRTRTLAAFLTDDVASWLDWYDEGKPEALRWGPGEDKQMLCSLPDFPGNDMTEEPVRWFQRTRELQVDGIAGPQTRTQLITEYMSHEETTLPQGTELVAHGCGESFPLPPEEAGSSEALAVATDRRIELFLFDGELGIQPPPPSDLSTPASLEYPEWEIRASQKEELVVEDHRLLVRLVEFEDVLFKTNSAVPLPQDPDEELVAGQGPGPSALRSVAAALMYAYRYPSKSMHVAGHADTTADASINDPLSEKRGLTVLALIKGDRDLFRNTADEQCIAEDEEYILAWASERFGFGCSLQEHGGYKVNAIKAFQRSYNDSAERDAAGQAELDVDGDWGPLTWGAVYDLYGAGIADVLDGDQGDGSLELLRAYRESVRFTDPAHESSGYGERYPLENPAVDNYRSQANRRVEVLFFDPDENPNLGLPPDDSEVYDDRVYRRIPLPPLDEKPLGIRYALLPTYFGHGRTFPKPSCLSTLRLVAQTANSQANLRLVIVGHTDHSIPDAENEELSLNRAEAVKALLSHDADYFRARFNTADPMTVWDFQEVQWMLHAIEGGAGPYYVGEVDAYPGDATRDALGSYQFDSEDLEVDQGCTEETLAQLIHDYLHLIESPVPADRIETVAGGSWSPPSVPGAEPEPEEEGAEDELSTFNRRVEVFLFERPVVPPADSVDPSTRRTSPTYRAWSRRSTRETDPAPVPYAIRLTDYRLVPIGNAGINIQRYDRESDAFEPFSGGALDEFGNAHVNLPPGTYRVEFAVDGVTEAFALHAHVDESAGFAPKISRLT